MTVGSNMFCENHAQVYIEHESFFLVVIYFYTYKCDFLKMYFKF